MLTEQPKNGLARILEISSPSDVKNLIESKFAGVLPDSKSRDDITKAILKHVQKPSEILCHKNIRRDVIASYLKEIGVRVQKEQSKDACIKICLDKWLVKDDNFWAKQQRSGGVLQDLSLLDNYICRKTEASREHCLKKNKLMKKLKPVEEQNILPRLKFPERDVDEVQTSSPSQVLTMSPAEKQLNSTEKCLLSSPTPVDSVTERKRESTSFTASSHISCDAVDLFGELSTSSLESSESLPTISEPERDQLISPQVHSPSSSASTYHDNERQSTFPLKTLSGFSSGLYSQVMCSEQPSSKPFSFSSQLLDMNLPSMCVTENEFKSVTDTPVLRSVNSGWISEIERESPELPSTQPFSISTEMDNPPIVKIVNDECKSVSLQPSVSSTRFRCIEECESSKATQTSTSRPLACGRPVSNASVQTLLSEAPVLPNPEFHVPQENQKRMWPSKKDRELSESRANLCSTKTLNHKRQLAQQPGKECTLSHHKNRNDSPPFPKRKDCRDGISDAKRNRWASPSNHGDTSAFLNVNKSESNFSECPNCKIQYSVSFHYGERKKLAVSSKSQYNKKRRPRSLSKNAGSPEKQQRLSMTSKQVKETSSASHVSRRASMVIPKTRIYKRKYPTPLPKKEISPIRDSRCQLTFASKQPCFTSSDSSEHHKKSTLPFKKIHRNTSVSRNHEDKELSKLSTERLPSENPAEERPDSTPRSESAPPKLLSLHKIKSVDCTPEASNASGSPPSESPVSDLEKSLSRPKRRYCILI